MTLLKFITKLQQHTNILMEKIEFKFKNITKSTYFFATVDFPWSKTLEQRTTLSQTNDDITATLFFR